MNTNQHSETDPTVEYYNTHAKAFVERSMQSDLGDAYRRFTALLPVGGRILDAGCGSGRDSKYFIEQCFVVEAFDASEKMVEYASQYAGLKVKQMRFEQIEYCKEFDGVWACASLLHVAKDEYDSVLKKLARALSDGGIMYLSLKESESTVPAEGRHFSYYSTGELEQIISNQDDLLLLDTWTKEWNGCVWVNLLASKK
jgi:2-polyprenyl-3-methyl-5-hydroxy-6-metoxy-1,4-benzoquinol methylase